MGRLWSQLWELGFWHSINHRASVIYHIEALNDVEMETDPIQMTIQGRWSFSSIFDCVSGGSDTMMTSNCHKTLAPPCDRLAENAERILMQLQQHEIQRKGDEQVSQRDDGKQSCRKHH